MNTSQAFQLDHRRLRLQSWRHMLLGLLLAIIINIICVIVLAALIDPSPVPQPGKRLYQVQQQEPIKPVIIEKKQRAQEKAITEAMPPMPAMPASTTAHAFTFPGTYAPALRDATWHAQMDLSGLQIPEAQIVLDKRARLKFIPDLARYYPRSAKRQGISGHTLLELVIGTDGRIESYTIKESMPPGVFDEQARKVIPHIRYEAAELDGKPHQDRRLFKLSWGIQ